MNKEIKAKIAELEEQSEKISNEIWKLRRSMECWYVGILRDPDCSDTYVRLGKTDYDDAYKKTEEYGYYAFDIEEITEEQNLLFMQWESVASIIANLGDLIYRKPSESERSRYNELFKEFTIKRQEIQDKLEISRYSSIML